MLEQLMFYLHSEVTKVLAITDHTNKQWHEYYQKKTLILLSNIKEQLHFSMIFAPDYPWSCFMLQ